MSYKKIAIFTLTFAAMLLLMASCSEFSVRRGPVLKPGRGNGPPPHAKAHGYRWKHATGVELVFDSGLGVYIVVGYPDYYYYDGYFYRFCGGAWEISSKPDRGWAGVSSVSLPAGLKAKGSLSKGNNGKGKGNGNGNGQKKKTL
jgi:hypothetical protein